MVTDDLANALANAERLMRPTEEQVAGAAAILREVADHLASTGHYSEAFPQGSHTRGTSCQPLGDVDLVAVLGDELQEWGKTAEGAFSALDSLYGDLSHLSRSDRLFQLAETPSSVHVYSRRSAGVDVSVTVPLPSAEGDDLLAADARLGGWKAINPHELQRVVAERDEALNGNFARQVRLAKLVASNLLKRACAPLPGFVVESLAFTAIASELPDAEALRLVLLTGAENMGTGVPDPTGHDDVTRKMRAPVIQEWKGIFHQAHRSVAGDNYLVAGGQALLDNWNLLISAPPGVDVSSFR